LHQESEITKLKTSLETLPMMDGDGGQKIIQYVSSIASFIRIQFPDGMMTKWMAPRIYNKQIKTSLATLRMMDGGQKIIQYVSSIASFIRIKSWIA